jgi:glucose 1-dehydrogenase
MKDIFDLTGKRALVTGSARGIGKGIALALAEHGATLIVHGSRESAPLDATFRQILAISPASVKAAADLAEPDAAARLMAAAGEPDILVANASVQCPHPWLEPTEQDDLLQMQVNFHSTLRLFRLAVPAMKARGWGRLVSVGSVQELRPHVNMPVYAASKAALENLVRNVALQTAAFGITCNDLCPGVFDTDRNKAALDDPAYRDIVRARIPARDFAQPSDMAGAALLLCSDAGRYITGTTLRVDGGMGIV